MTFIDQICQKMLITIKNERDRLIKLKKNKNKNTIEYVNLSPF